MVPAHRQSGKYIRLFYLKPSSIPDIVRENRSGRGAHYGFVVCRTHRRIGGADLGWRRAVCATDEAAMSALYWVALLVTLGLFGYLLYAMLNAEKF
jgi:K+-transporting ATPase KdpF subunit